MSKVTIKEAMGQLAANRIALKNLIRDMQGRKVVKDPNILEKWSLLEKANAVAIEVMDNAVLLADAVLADNKEDSRRLSNAIKQVML
jgi:hypothetical protein